MNPTVRPGEHPRPLLTAIMPVYSGAAFLAEGIRHVLAQHYHPLEFIVVDDGSTDDTADIAAAFSDHIRYGRQPNQGPAAARNSGTRIARGSSWRFSTSMICGLSTGRPRRLIPVFARCQFINTGSAVDRNTVLDAAAGGHALLPWNTNTAPCCQ